jgi:hypothetical protein
MPLAKEGRQSHYVYAAEGLRSRSAYGGQRRQAVEKRQRSRESLPLDLTNHIEHDLAPIYRGTMGLSQFRSRPTDLLLDNAASYNLVS